ncbi:TetR/AcrR family transcriptional regulator [Actinopolymorpha alba]|uniref:TetR/AcrR family transcriptional regulator n=1 Tax=Actinopolymorpha alba TaxID=533267 RepID=UPI0003784CF3|nr:TetR/AcrR family transcriptional regulator [Actinopolymorpha alba]
MSPRGVSIPEIRQQLFEAADAVLLREDPSRLSGRAITREAGCATGLLYNHFTDFDGFLTEYILDRAKVTATALLELPSRAGSGTVAGNLQEAMLTMLDSRSRVLVSLVMTRPSLVARLGKALGEEPAFYTGERAMTAYLEAEKEHGRVRADADTESLALALVGIAHQLLLAPNPGTADPPERMRRAVTALVAGVTGST